MNDFISHEMKINFEGKNKGNKDLLNSKPFENYLIFNFVTGYTLKQVYYPRLRKEIETLLDLVERELLKS